MVMNHIAVCRIMGGNSISVIFFFFFNDTATTEIYTLSLHDALPISSQRNWPPAKPASGSFRKRASSARDRKSTRLNSSHLVISYAVFCLKKKKDHINSSSKRAANETCFGAAHVDKRARVTHNPSRFT